MTFERWAMASALVAGVLGALGPYVIARLPISPDADEDAPSFAAIARARFLGAWLAAGAVALLSIVALAVPAHLLPAWAVTCGVGIWLAYVDWRTKILPTRIILPLDAVLLIIVAIEAWAARDEQILMRGAAGGVVMFCVYWVFWWVAGLRSPGSFGFGDVRFSAPLGLVLGTVGWWALPVGLYLGILVGGIAGLVFKARGQAAGFALGPWMLLGAVLGPLVSG
jgi:leader peptidase (prepilin peptidase)/N-methyltransferase